jgi:hypothetical protein
MDELHDIRSRERVNWERRNLIPKMIRPTHAIKIMRIKSKKENGSFEEVAK